MRNPAQKPGRSPVRSLPIAEWPEADRLAWEAACRPGQRLVRGGRASHLKPITRDDLARRYGYFLDHLSRSATLDLSAHAGSQVTPENVARFVAELQQRVGSVTVYGSICKLRRAAELLAPALELAWLKDIEQDLCLEMRPRSKNDRLVLTEILVEAGMTLMLEAEAAAHLTPLKRARQYRNGLMVALLACCPIRLKNFAVLELNRTLHKVGESWWICLPASDTKERRPDERPIPEFLQASIEKYLTVHHPCLARDVTQEALWLSSNDGKPMSYSAVEKVLTETTRSTLGVPISPHLFRTAGATTSATYAPRTPHLASALLHHLDPQVTEQHYNRATSLSAARSYAAVSQLYREQS